MVHARHAAAKYPKVVVISEDTDVFVILLGLHSGIATGSRILLRRGEKNKVRLIDVSRLATILGQAVCTALVGVHAWTGCDSVSAFAGQGKVKAINLIRKSQTYREAFMAIYDKSGTFRMNCSIQYRHSPAACTPQTQRPRLSIS